MFPTPPRINIMDLNLSSYKWELTNLQIPKNHVLDLVQIEPTLINFSSTSNTNNCLVTRDFNLRSRQHPAPVRRLIFGGYGMLQHHAFHGMLVQHEHWKSCTKVGYLSVASRFRQHRWHHRRVRFPEKRCPEIRTWVFYLSGIRGPQRTQLLAVFYLVQDGESKPAEEREGCGLNRV